MKTKDQLRPIPSIPHAYACEDGHIYSDHPSNRWRGRLVKLTPSDNGRGYLRVRCGGKARCVHKLVAEAFLGSAPPGFEVNHVDGTKANNRPGNLEYVSRSENMKHAHRRGLARPKFGENHPNSVISDEDAATLLAEHRSMLVGGKLPNGGAAMLASKYGVSKAYVIALAGGHTRRWMQEGARAE